MIKKFVIIFFIPILLFPQEEKRSDQSIELPEFVITGVERVSLPVVVKPKAELIPVLSEDFFKPAYSPEELQIAEISNPVKKDIDLFNKTTQYDGRLVVGAGINTIPKGELTYGKSFNNGLFLGRVWGSNDREYIDNAGLNNSGIELNTSLFVNNNSGFLSGTKFNIGGSYFRESYKYFTSDTPSFKRDLHFGNIHLNISNQLNENFKYVVKLSDDIFYIKDNKLNENVFSGEGYLEAGLPTFYFGGNLEYKNQNLKNNINAKSNYNFLGTSAYLTLKNTDDYKLKFGIAYAKSDTNSFFNPQAFFALKLNKRITFLADYSPNAELLTMNDIFSTNRYLRINTVDNFFLEEKVAFNIALRYEYETYFEIDGGFRYSDFENYLYFNDSSEKGKFDIKGIEARKFNGFVNLLFHLGPYGVFYGSVDVQEIKDDFKKYVPYNPVINSHVSYSYKFPFGLLTESKLLYNSSSYADSLNLIKVPAFIDLSFKLSYELFNNFSVFSEINNILNNKNYHWLNYKEKPLDLILGIDYRW